MQALAFHNTQFDIVDRDGQPWLQAAQIAKALGYAREDAISRIFSRNADEFTTCMSQTVKLTVKGFGSGNSEKEVRIFSLRGAHLLAMFARTKVAKEFRRWVLDVLDGEAEVPAKAKRTPKQLPNGLTTDQQEAIKALVKARVGVLPKDKQAKAAITCWSALKSKFGCTYKAIAAESYIDAVSLVARVPLEGEFIGREERDAGTVLDDHQLYDVWFVMRHFESLYDIFNRSNLYTHLTALGSRIGIEMIDHFRDGHWGVSRLKKLDPEFDAVQRRLKLNQYATFR